MYPCVCAYTKMIIRKHNKLHGWNLIYSIYSKIVDLFKLLDQICEPKLISQYFYKSFWFRAFILLDIFSDGIVPISWQFAVIYILGKLTPRLTLNYIFFYFRYFHSMLLIDFIDSVLLKCQIFFKISNSNSDCQFLWFENFHFSLLSFLKLYPQNVVLLLLNLPVDILTVSFFF